MSFNNKNIEIYIDGSCNPNPGTFLSSGLVFCVENKMKSFILYTSRSKSKIFTNIMSECYGLYLALKTCEQFKITLCNINIMTDSEYVLNTFNNKFNIKYKKYDINIKKILRKLINNKNSINVLKVKAHSDIKYNIFVDNIAYWGLCSMTKRLYYIRK